MLKVVNADVKGRDVDLEIRLHKLWTHLYMGVAVVFTLLLTQLFGPWAVLEIWEAWTGLSLSLVP